MKKKRFRSEVDSGEKLRRRNSIIIGVVLIALMGFSVLSYSFYGTGGSSDSSNTDIKYNGHTLKTESTNGVTVLTTNWNGTKIFFYSAPLYASAFMNKDFEAVYPYIPTIAFTKPPLGVNDTNFADEQYYNYMFNDIQGFSGKKIIVASTRTDLLNDLPVLTCSDASPNRLVIVLNNTNVSGTVDSGLETINSYCFRADATGLDILSLRDYILYTGLGVKE